MAAIVVVGSLANSLAFVTGLVALELIPGGTWQDAVLRFWIGDGVGIFVTFPFLWWLQDRPRREVFRLALLRLETAGYLGLVLAILADLLAGRRERPPYLYALFLPVVWAASRQGITGAISAPRCCSWACFPSAGCGRSRKSRSLNFNTRIVTGRRRFRDRHGRR
jgi:integral membrane sensor domain MASE1